MFSVATIEVEEFAVCIEMAGRGWGENPAGGLVKEEVHSPGPSCPGEQDVGGRLPGNPLPATQFHNDVEGGIEQQVDDENPQQEAGEVSTLHGELAYSETGKCPVADIEDDEKYHPVRVLGPEGGPGAAAAAPHVVVQRAPGAARQPSVQPPPAHVVSLQYTVGDQH